jgi:hypothetical protein
MDCGESWQAAKGVCPSALLFSIPLDSPSRTNLAILTNI